MTDTWKLLTLYSRRVVKMINVLKKHCKKKKKKKKKEKSNFTRTRNSWYFIHSIVIQKTLIDSYICTVRVKRAVTYFVSLSHLFPTMTIGTFKLKWLLLLLFVALWVALTLVSRIDSRSLMASSNDSRQSKLNTTTNRSPAMKKKENFDQPETFIFSFFILDNSTELFCVWRMRMRKG